MERDISLSRISSRSLIVFFLLFPFLMLFSRIGEWLFPPAAEILHAFLFTCAQSFLSALLSVALGFWGAQGLIHWRRGQKLFQVLVLLPNVFPSLFVILAFLKLLDPFPFGLAGIVILHTAMNVGLCSIVIHQLFLQKIAGWAELALVEGANRFRFRLVVIQYLRRDLALLFIFIFAICFSSLAVPLIAGGYRGTTLEVLIFEKIRVSGKWGEALAVAAFQSAFLFSLSWILFRQKTLNIFRHTNLSMLRSRSGILIPLLVTALILMSQVRGCYEGYRQIFRLGFYALDLPASFLGTFIVSFGTGLFTALLLLLICFGLPHKYYQRFLLGYVAPSSVLTGFAVLLVSNNLDFVSMIFAITLVQLPYFYRLQLSGIMESLENQIIVAKSLGASWNSIFFQVVFPQISSAVGYSAGLSALWASGDFAISSLVTNRASTAALVAKELMESYRLEAAGLVTLGIIFCGAFCWLMFWRLGYVLGAKPIS